MASRLDKPFLLVDSHVHLHRCFQEEVFLEGAVSNFREGSRRLRLPGATTGVLALTDIHGEDSIERLERWTARSSNAWRARQNADGASLVLTSQANGENLILIAGRQIVTRQGLEVLALGSRENLDDGQSLLETLASVRSAGALAVLPWGFGKWWFRRGRLLENLLEETDGHRLFLGDNAGRPRWGSRPRAFRLAKERGVHILPGSDPLPFAAHAGRAGSYGAVFEGELDSERPAAALVRLLRENRGQLRGYGDRRPFWSFVSDQVAMQLRKRRLWGS